LLRDARAKAAKFDSVALLPKIVYLENAVETRRVLLTTLLARESNPHNA
jgi:hypothetical protein